MYISKIKPQLLSIISDLSGIGEVRGIFEPMLKDGKLVYVNTDTPEFEMAEINDTEEEGGYVRFTNDVTYSPGVGLGACSKDTVCAADMVFVAWSRNRPAGNLLDGCIHAVNRVKFSVPPDIYDFETALKKSSNNPHGIIASEFNIIRPQMGILSICKVEFSVKYSVSCSSVPVAENC